MAPVGITAIDLMIPIHNQQGMLRRSVLAIGLLQMNHVLFVEIKVSLGAIPFLLQ